MLEISRPDVERSFIVERDINSRFIKLPVSRYLELLGIDKTMNDPQRALINVINDPKYRFICAAFARRLGKTYIANIIAQLVILVPQCHVLIMSPNYSLSSISFDLQRKLIKHFDLEIVRDNLKDRVIELENGSTVRAGSVSQVDSCVGRSYDLILFDEAALGKDAESAFNIALRPTMDKPGSKAIFISTPRGKKNWFSQFYMRGFNPEYPEWVSMCADYTENPRMTESDVAEARKIMSRAEFEQEYMANFTSFEGQIYKLPGENVVDYYPQDITEFFAGMDPGYRDETAFIVLGYSPSEDCFYVVDEYLRKEATTDKHADAFRVLIDKWQIETIFMDPAAAQFGADLAYIYDIATTKAKKQVLEGIAYCQSIVDTSRLKVMSSCEHTLAALDQYQWDPSETLLIERPLHNFASHMADAMRYALYTYTL